MTFAPAAGARVLLTGSTGFVGKVVLEELLRRRDELGLEQIYLLIRPRKGKSPEERFDQNIAASPCFSLLNGNWRSLCRPIGGDMTDGTLGLSNTDAARLRKEITHIIHCAASVEFDLPLAEATAINITGALRVLDFAQSCTRLKRLVHVSTAYVTPHPGETVPVEEKLVNLPFDAEQTYASIVGGFADEKALLAQTGHANTYTFTKCISELVLANRRGDTPLSIVRPSIVSACRRHPFPGWIDSRAAYAGFISLLGAGHLKVVRVNPNAILDVVPCDDVAHRIISCAFDPSLQSPMVVRHAVAGLANSGLVSRLAYTHERYFQAHPHEKEARWVYIGDSAASFRFHEWLHHHVPVGAARVAVRLVGEKKQVQRIDRLAEVLTYLNEAFFYFAHNTFDFRTAFPPLEDFDLDEYLESVSHGISEHLLKRNPLEAPLRMHGNDLTWAFRQPGGNATVRSFAYVLRKALRTGGAEITFNEAEIKAARRTVRDDDLIVLAPSHRSYLDFLVTSLLCFAHPGLRLQLPKVAATDDFSRIPIVGRVLRGGGAFYIKRGTGKADPELNKQIAKLVHDGHSLEFYPEGKRSRARRFLAPKRGILRALQDSGRPAVILPLAISYDRIAEEEGFLRELDGRAKHKGGLLPLAKWTARLMSMKIRMGRIHIRCGSPIRLDGDSDVKELSREIVAELQRHMVATTYHLQSFCERHPALHLDPAELRQSIVRRGGVVLESKLKSAAGVPELIQRTYDSQWMHLFYADAVRRGPENAAVSAHVRINGYWFPERPHNPDGNTDGIVDALFEPVCRDYQRVATAIESMPADGVTSAHQLVRELPGAFLGDVEDALHDLAARGVLKREKEHYRWADGTRDLSDYRAACVWEKASHAGKMIS